MRSASRPWVVLGALGLALVGCRASPTEDGDGGDRSAAAPDGRGEEMPASLRCKRSSDCVQKPSCYWEQPTCIAAGAAGAVEKCSEDADPESKGYPAATCDCFEGQCVVK